MESIRARDRARCADYRKNFLSPTVPNLVVSFEGKFIRELENRIAFFLLFFDKYFSGFASRSAVCSHLLKQRQERFSKFLARGAHKICDIDSLFIAALKSI